MGATLTGRERLAVVIVSHNDAHWLPACLASIADNAGDLDVEIVVVDSGSTDETGALVAREYPDARLVTTENRGFAAGNNRGLEVVDAEWVLFLNPDTEIVSGRLEELVSELRRRPEVGLAGVRQFTTDGALYPTMRRFPTALRSFLRERRVGAASVPRPVARRTRARPRALRPRDGM